MKSVYQTRKEIIHVCTRIYQRGYVAANDGNVSVRLSDDQVLITPTGMSKGFLTEDQLILFDRNGNSLSGALNPSSELKMHLMIYRERADVNAVVHAHPVTATGFAVAGIPLAQCVLPEVVIALGSIPITEYGTPSTEELPNSIQHYIHEYDAFLLENHGALTIGPDVLNAYHKMETIEHFAQIVLVARRLGHVGVLSDENVQKLMQVRERLGVKGKNPGCQACTVGCPRNIAQSAAQRKDHPAEKSSTSAESDGDLIRRITEQVMARLT